VDDASANRGFLETSVRAVVAYLPADPKPVEKWIGDARPEFVCFLYEDDPSYLRVRNEFLARFMSEHLDTFVDPVPLPKNPTDSFEWLYSKMNWEVDYFLEKYPGSKVSDMVFCVSSDQVPIVVVLYTVALQRGTRFAYLDVPARASSKTGVEGLVHLPNLFHVSGEPYRSSALRKYREGRFADAADDFRTAYERAGDKQMEALRLLSECYAFLDRLAYGEALKKLEELAADENCCQKLGELTGSNVKNELLKLRSFLEVASRNFGYGTAGKEFIKVFSDPKAVEVFVRSLYVSSSRKVDHGEYEAASLLLYRIIEAVAQAKLASKGIDVSQFNAAQLSDDKRRDFAHFKAKVYQAGNEELTLEPQTGRLGLADAWILYLSVFYGNEVEGITTLDDKVRYMQRIRSFIELRNSCYLEHGTRGVSKEDAERFQQFTAALTKSFLGIKLLPPEEDDVLRPLRFAEQQ